MLGQRNDQRRALDAGEERAREQQSELRMAPAHQGLHARQKTRHRVEARLVVHLDLATVERTAEIAHHAEAPDVVDARIRCVQCVLATSVRLCLVHRDVTRAQEFGCRVSVVGKERHPDARAHVDMHPVEHDGPAQRVEEALSHDPPARCSLRVAHHDAELVATKPRDQLVPAEGLDQSECDDAKELVADVVSKGVVDVLESIEVDEQQRHAPTGRSCLVDRVAEMAQQHPAIRQTRQLVAERQFAGVEEHEVLAKGEAGADQGNGERRARQPHGSSSQPDVMVGDECRDCCDGDAHGGKHPTHFVAALGRRDVVFSQPGRERHHQHRSGESEVDERANRHLADRYGVHVDAVTDGQRGGPEEQQHPAWRESPLGEREVRDHTRQDQEIANRVGEVGRDAEPPASEGAQYRIRDDCRVDGRDGKCADQPVDQGAGASRSDAVSDEAREREQHERVERQPEGIRDRRKRRLLELRVGRTTRVAPPCNKWRRR